MASYNHITEIIKKMKNLLQFVQTSYFPRIFRFITEKPSKQIPLHYTKLFVVSFISGVIVFCITLQVFSLQQNMQQVKLVSRQREHLLGEVKYWQQMADKYKNYRDIYYKLATLQYAVGNTQDARANIQKALSLDPNFVQGRVLAEKLAAK